MTGISRRAVCAALGTGLGAFALPGAMAQAQWQPDKPIRIVTSSGPGGTLDVAARLFAELATQSLGQPVVVDSKPGASGMIATEIVARAPADGHTILFINGAIVQNEILRSDRRYKFSDLQPLALIAKMPIAFSASATTKANTLADWVRMARANPKDFSWASYGKGSSGHILGAALQHSAKLHTTHVPYNGEGPVVNALLGDVVTAAFGSPGLYGKHEQAGKVKVLAITSKHSAVPNVPTFAEAGFPDISMEGFLSAFVPANTPPAAVARLWAEMQRALAEPKVRDALVAAGGRVEPLGPQPFADYLRKDIQDWSAAVKNSNITLD